MKAMRWAPQGGTKHEQAHAAHGDRGRFHGDCRWRTPRHRWLRFGGTLSESTHIQAHTVTDVRVPTAFDGRYRGSDDHGRYRDNDEYGRFRGDDERGRFRDNDYGRFRFDDHGRYRHDDERGRYRGASRYRGDTAAIGRRTLDSL